MSDPMKTPYDSRIADAITAERDAALEDLARDLNQELERAAQIAEAHNTLPVLKWASPGWTAAVIPCNDPNCSCHEGSDA